MKRKSLPEEYFKLHRTRQGRTNILQEPRLLRREPSFARMSKAEHLALAEELTKQAIREQNIQQRYLRLAGRKYGEGGHLLTFGSYEDWPMPAKESARIISRERSNRIDAAFAHYKAAGKRRHYGVFYRELESRMRGRKTSHARTK